MTTVITVAALGGNDMAKWCNGWAGRGGKKIVESPTTNNLISDAIPREAEELDEVIRQTLAIEDGDVVVFAHSRGCQIVGEWLREYANADPSRLSFVLTGNLERAFFGYAANKVSWIPAGNLRGLTPNDTAFSVLDIGRAGDRWAHFPGGLWAMMSLPFCRPHLDYSSVDPDTIPWNQVVKVVGHTTYVTAP